MRKTLSDCLESSRQGWLTETVGGDALDGNAEDDNFRIEEIRNINNKTLNWVQSVTLARIFNLDS